MIEILPEEIETPQEDVETKDVETKKGVEIFGVDELEKLPEGVCLLSEDEFERGNAVVGRILVEKILEKKLTPHLIEIANQKETQPEYVVGPLFANITQNSVYRMIVDEFSEEYPNLCWFRGATYLETADGAPRTTNFTSFGGNGYIGDHRAISYAERDYNQAKHSNPVLFIVTLKDLLKGVDNGAIGLGSEHDYDVVLYEKANYTDWAIRNIGICDLGNSPDDFKKATEILKSKATIVK